MTDRLSPDELYNALLGIFAFDMGSVDSGIHDELLRKRLIRHMEVLSEADRRVILSRVMREAFLTEEALELGYGWEDAYQMAEWIDGGFGGHA